MEKQLSRIDLNLLVAFQVLIEECNVTRAADRLFISQPAMSKTLQRLRDAFDDPLFTRSAHGLVPTPKAEELRHPVESVLKQLEETIFTPKFNPGTFRGDIHINGPEVYAIGVIPRLIRRLKEIAPGIKLHSRSSLLDHLEDLASGLLDFSIYVDQPYSDEFEVTALTTVRPNYWMRVDHPLSKKRSITTADLFFYPRIILHFPNVHNDAMLNIVREAETKGHKREEYFETSQLLTALEVLGDSDALMLGPPWLADFNLTGGHFVSREPPKDPLFDTLEIPLALIQHRRTLNSPVHRWIKEHIIEIYQRPTIRA